MLYKPSPIPSLSLKLTPKLSQIRARNDGRGNGRDRRRSAGLIFSTFLTFLTFRLVLEKLNRGK